MAQNHVQKPSVPLQTPSKPNLANRIFDAMREDQEILDKALFHAIDQGSLEDVRNFLIGGANPNATERKLSNTPLMKAISSHSRDRMEIVKLLVSHGADVNIRRKDGKFTALMMAGQIGDYEMCKFLLDHGADPNLRKDDGITALMMSTRNESVCQLMINRNADINATDNEKMTPLIHAALSGDALSCELLVIRGANIDAQDNLGRTALMLAAHGGYYNACRMLLQKGANTRLVNKYDYKTAYDMAKDCGTSARDGKTISILALYDMFGSETKKLMSLLNECFSL